MTHRHSTHSHTAAHKPHDRKPVFSKVFRWRAPDGQNGESVVEVAGTFSDWKKLPMMREATGGWHLTLQNIPSNRTHHYMIFADGKPVQDKNSDGLAMPQGAQEEQSAISTPRGLRVFMLFAQTK
jgi:1,4-alpha-glucan branching enzyme